jgi:hypothetical protein
MDRIGAYRADCLLWDCEWVLRASMAARCAYLDEPLYRQRLDGQGTSSRGDRELDHLKSGFNMTWRLYSSPPFPTSARHRELLRQAASNGATSLAYYHAQHGQIANAMRAWWRSQTIAPSLRGLRFALSVLRDVSRRRTRSLSRKP